MGHLGDSSMIAAIGLGNLIQQMLVMGVIFGFNSTCENEMSKAFGAKNLRNLSLYFNRGKLVLTLAFAFIFVAIFNIEKMLIKCEQDPRVSKYTANYMLWYFPGLLTYGYCDL